MKILLRWLVSLAMVTLALVLLAPPAYAQPPPMPHSFYGTIKLNGSDAPTSTTVTAKFAGEVCGTYITTEDGKYGDLMTSDYLSVTYDGLHSGDTINFYVNGVNTNQTASFVPGGGPTELNQILGALSGDASGDGVVDAVDITGVERIIAGLDDQTPGADANEDGNINALDITRVEMIIAGMD